MCKDRVSIRSEVDPSMYHTMSTIGIEIRRPTPYIVINEDNIREFAFFTEIETRNIWASVTINGVFYSHFAVADEEIFNDILNYIDNARV